MFKPAPEIHMLFVAGVGALGTSIDAVPQWVRTLTVIGLVFLAGMGANRWIATAEKVPARVTALESWQQEHVTSVTEPNLRRIDRHGTELRLLRTAICSLIREAHPEAQDARLSCELIEQLHREWNR